jgi:hypothetical protein
MLTDRGVQTSSAASLIGSIAPSGAMVAPSP